MAVLNPPAELETRASDEDLTPEQVLQIALFKDLKKKPTIVRFPGSYRLRRFDKDEEILRQGEAGWSAFYILTTEDLLALRQGQLQAVALDEDRVRLQEEIASLEQRQVNSNAGDSLESERRKVATVHLAVPRPADSGKRGWFQTVLGKFFGKGKKEKKAPLYIPFDGPTDIAYDTQQANLYEGEIFGEMSCLNLAVRAATVVCRRPWYVLEMLRNIFTEVYEDRAYHRKTEQTYRRRVLEMHLRKLTLFQDLTDAEFAQLHPYMDFENVWPLLDSAQPIQSWPGLCASLAEAAKQTAGLTQLVWQDLPAECQQTIRASATGGPLSAQDREVIVQGLNALIQNGKFSEQAELQPLLAGGDIREKVRSRGLPVNRKDWLPQDFWEVNRFLLEAIFPDLFCQRIEINRFQPGELICDEHERSDSMYLIRTGIVQVIKNVSRLVSVADIANWQEIGKALGDPDKPPAGPISLVWNRLAPATLELTRQLAAGANLEMAQKWEIIHTLNAAVMDRHFYEPGAYQGHAGQQAIAGEAASLDKDRNKWSDAEIRHLNRLCLDTIFPSAIRPYRPALDPPILAYCSRGDILGEMGLLLQLPRNATCLAYGHSAKVKRSGEGLKSGALNLTQGFGMGRFQASDAAEEQEFTKGSAVEVVQISKSLFDRLVNDFPAIRRKVEEVVGARQKSAAQRTATPAWDGRGGSALSQKAKDLNLVQGQRLMLIDLESCTRCNECVNACVEAHPHDQRSRLFLTGPRFDKYLVPTTCRSCLDPVCMTDCPVGSIHRGDMGQMIIENWCIGCRQCADLCPYDAIQMHGLGLIPEHASGWRFIPAACLSSGDESRWTSLKFDDNDWLRGEAPFVNDWLFQSRLTGCIEGAEREAKFAGDQRVLFRFQFQVSKGDLQPGVRFKLQVTSSDPTLAFWVNGQPITAEKRGQYTVLGQSESPDGVGGLRAGSNVLAASIAAPPEGWAKPLDLFVCEEHRPEGGGDAKDQHTEKVVERVAVVCDMCSSLSGGPRCVMACPHDAAQRLDFQHEYSSR